MIGAAFAGTAHAQTEADPAAQPEAGEQEGPVIIVTAQKRAERLIDVPISIAALDERVLERTGAATIEDVGRSLANVSLPDGSFDSRPKITIRGVFSNVRNLGFEDGVVVYLDQVPVGRREGFGVPLDDIERVEVLRGPQGTLYGKNSISGAINIVSKKPEYDVFGGTVTAQYGNFDFWTLRGSVNIPLVEGRAALRISANHSQRDGFITNVFDGSRLGSNNVDNVRAQLQFDVGDSLTVLLAADYLDAFSELAPQEPLNGPGFVPGPYTVNFNAPDNFEDRQTGGAALTLDYELGGGFSLTSITAYRSAKVRLAYDQDLSPVDLFTIDFRDEVEQFSQELRIASPGDAEWGTFIIGGQYFWQEARFDRPVPGGSVFGGELLGSNVGEVTTKTYAVFSHVNVNLTDALTAFGGLRYTSDTKDNDFRQIFSPTGSAVFLLPSIPRTLSSRTDKELTYTLGTRYALTPDSSIYATISTGFKGGGFNNDFVVDTNPDGFTFEPETATNYEIGYKGVFFDRRMSLNAAIFYLDYQDLQVSNFNGLSFVIRNAASARALGGEIELTAEPVDDLILSGSLGYTDAEFREYILQPGVDFSGNPLLRAPEWTASAAIDYSFYVTERLQISPRVDFTYVSDQYSNAATIPSNFIPSSSLFNARIGFGPDDDSWKLSAWVKNLTDQVVIEDAFPFVGADVVNYTPPRTYGIDATFSF
ncbi:TonB-dependent receptor [Erythrobacter sp. AP23]|uniref:TonB-dependent receptor n=1 Tax=Erythrobacter sp. AP23 TaxID=499656 RepID=UPI0018DD2CE0|nr:TonB-dependent receptor [Erythrobacter sp. AP23]